MFDRCWRRKIGILRFDRRFLWIFDSQYDVLPKQSCQKGTKTNGILTISCFRKFTTNVDVAMNCELTANEIVKKNIGFYSIFWKRTDIIQVRKSRSACEFDRKKRLLGDHWKMQKHWKNNGFWPILLCETSMVARTTFVDWCRNREKRNRRKHRKTNGFLTILR